MEKKITATSQRLISVIPAFETGGLSQVFEKWFLYVTLAGLELTT